MKSFSFHGGGLVPQCFSSTLKVEGDQLFGRRVRKYCEIKPGDIVEVREFSFSNPFLAVTTRNCRFHVGALNNQYGDVVRILESYVGSDFCHSLAHRFNVVIYRSWYCTRRN